MKTRDVIVIFNALSALLQDRACNGITAYRVHRAVSELGKITDAVRESCEKTVEAERNGHDEKAVAELRQKIWDALLEQEEKATAPKLPASGIDFGRGNPGAIQELLRRDLIEGEPAPA